MACLRDFQASTIRRLLVLVLLFGASLCGAAQRGGDLPRLEDVSLEQVKAFYPDALQLAAASLEVPLRPVFGRSGLAGYVFLTSDLAPIPAYSGHPVSVLVALDNDGQVVGLRIVAHQEPILVVGVKPQHLNAHIQQYVGVGWADKVRVNAQDRPGYRGVDGISGATITAMVINRSVMSSLKKVASYLQLDRGADKAGAAQTPDGLRATGPAAEQEEQLFWLQTWLQKPVSATLLSLALLLLLGILFFQDMLVRHPLLFNRLRLGYLLFTIVFIGYYLGGQLSILNILTFFQRIGAQFSWEVLLLDPALFLLWGFVAVTILLWGRGVFCGWLCPFGAMQDVIYQLSRRFKLPDWNFPHGVHERLWSIKYFILIALLGLSLDSIASAARFAEVEPFKTSISMMFQREWWFVSYALLLLVISAFNSKFYCKYLCSLGAALSIMGRFQIFHWLRRRNECGKPCQACAADCQIDAIRPTGEIEDAECHYCLSCQVIYWDDQTCPPLVDKRKRREKRQRRQDPGLIPVVDVDGKSAGQRNSGA